MTEEEKTMSGKLFDPMHEELVAIKRVAHNLCTDYNKTYEDETGKREEILSRLLKSKGENVFFQGPIYFNYGVHTSIGSNFFCNYNVCISDDAQVVIGDHVMFGPGCVIATPSHPLLEGERRSMTDSSGRSFLPCLAKPVRIGNDVWLASGVIVCGGVTIGDGAVIGAGSVVTKDIPKGVFACGSPCRPVREITEKDSLRDLLV